MQAASIADFAVKDMNEFHESVRLVGLGGRNALDLKDARKAEVIFNDMPFTHPIPRPGVIQLHATRQKCSCESLYSIKIKVASILLLPQAILVLMLYTSFSCSIFHDSCHGQRPLLRQLVGVRLCRVVLDT